MADKPFLTDIKTLRERARKHIEQGAVTQSYHGDRETILRLLNEALATELVCVLRYKRHYYMATGLHAEGAAAEFLQHAGEEQGHADELAARIVQLGGQPNFNPDGLTSRSHAEYVEGDSLRDQTRRRQILKAKFRRDQAAAGVAEDSSHEDDETAEDAG